MEEKSKTLSDEKIFTVANILTFCRIVLIAPFLYFFITERYIEATATVVASGLSDCFDGLLARKLNQVSDLGKLLDPVADKLTLVAVAVCICIMFPIVIPLMVILALKDLLMLCGGLYMIKKGIKPPAAKWYGKVGTIVFYFSVCLIVFLKAFFQIESDILTIVLMSLTAITMIFALVKYFQLFLKLRKENM
ncbi:MAG: CDP-alcohol phosphatidyltransferase family protein [Acutalibacteraceae bacterium]